MHFSVRSAHKPELQHIKSSGSIKSTLSQDTKKQLNEAYSARTTLLENVKKSNQAGGIVYSKAAGKLERLTNIYQQSLEKKNDLLSWTNFKETFFFKK